MATYIKFDSFVEALAEKKLDLGSDQLKVALTNTDPTVAAVDIGDVTEISYTNLLGATPLNLTTSSSAQTSGTYKLVLADLTLTASGGALPEFQWVVIYDSAATGAELIGYYNYGSKVNLASGDQFILDFDASTGVIQLV